MHHDGKESSAIKAGCCTHYIYLSIYPSIHPFIYLSGRMMYALYLSIYLSIHPSIYLSISISISIYLSIYHVYERWCQGLEYLNLRFRGLQSSRHYIYIYMRMMYTLRSSRRVHGSA
jgi:hypothetical protein